MNAKVAIRVLYIAWLVAAVMLVFAAVGRQSYSFYTLLRWVCGMVFAYSAVTSFKIKRVLWVWVFDVLLVLFNPLFSVRLDRSAWIVADWFSIGAIVIAAFAFWKDAKQ